MATPVSKSHVRLRLEAVHRSLTPAGQRLCDFILHDPLSPLAAEAGIVLGYAARPTAFSSDSLSGRIAQLLIADMLYAVIACSRYEQATQLIDQANLQADRRRIK